MKYNFDEIIDRRNDAYSFSTKWQCYQYATNRLPGITIDRKDTICLETADMDFKIAPEILEDLNKVTAHGILGYSEITDTYKKAVCDWYKKRQGWEFKPEDIIYTPGTHTAVNECVKRYTKINEGVILLTPCYSYHGDVDGNGRQYIKVDMINDGEENYTVDYEAFDKACADENNTMFILCHPHNPTGKIYTPEELLKISEICRKHDVLMVSDEVHSDILRAGEPFEPFMKVAGSKGVISCTAVNKTFNMAGLAMTNVVIEDPDLKAKFNDYWAMPTPYGIQAVISAYTKAEPWVNALNEYVDDLVDTCIDYVHAHLPKAKVARPQGGYSINIDFSGYGLSEKEVCTKIYTNAGVILNSGYFFDDKRKGLVHRACLASPKAVCLEALERIAKEFEGC